MQTNVQTTIDISLTATGLFILLCLFFGHSMILTKALFKQEGLPSHKSKRPMNRIKARTSSGALMICLTQIMVLVCSLMITVRSDKLSKIANICLMIAVEVVGTIVITNLLLMVARVHCSSLIHFVVQRLPHLRKTGNRVQKFVFIAEVLFITLGSLPKIGADIRYYSEFSLNPSITHSHKALFVKTICDRIFDVSATIATMSISIPAICFTIYFSRTYKHKRRPLFLTQAMIACFITYSILRTICIGVLYGIRQHGIIHSTTSRLATIHSTAILRIMLLCAEMIIMIVMPDHVNHEEEEIAEEERGILATSKKQSTNIQEEEAPPTSA